MLSPASHELFRELIDSGRRFILTTHMNPDGDAIGSEIGLARYLLSLGKDVRIINNDRTPSNLAFLEDGDTGIEVFDDGRHRSFPEEADLVILLDNSAPDRLGGMEPVIRRHADRVFCIDHHPTRSTIWKHNLLSQQACATAAIVFDLIQAAGWQPDSLAAEALYVGVSTDTGFFRFNSTTPHAYEIAAVLMRAGVEPARIYRRVYERNTPAFTRLLGHALQEVGLHAEGQVAKVVLTNDTVTRYAATHEDTSEIATYLLAIDGVRIATIFRELAPGRVKVSLRSKGQLDVRQLAIEFGGGGHRNASGIVTDGQLDAVVTEIVERTTALVHSAAE